MTAPQAPLRILAVDDSADDAALMGRALLEGGLAFELRVVDEEAGLRTELASFLPDLLLIDWHLPDYSAAGAIAAARDWDQNVPCILVSGSIGEELVVEALRNGATDYVLKHHLEALAPAIRRAIAEEAARRETARLEAALTTTQQALRGSLDAMTDSFVICAAVRDGNGAISDFAVVFANQAAASYFGMPPADAAGRQVSSELPVALRDDLYGACLEVVETHHGYQAQRVVTWRTSAQSREETWVDLTIEPFGDGFFLVSRDVTDRMVITRERDRLAAVVEESFDGMTIANPDGLVTYANAAFQAMVDLPLVEIVGQPMPVVAGKLLDAETIAWMETHVRSAGALRREVVLMTSGGASRRVELAISPRMAGDDTVSSIVTILHDVTDLREAQADLALQVEVRSQVAEILRAVREDATLEQAAQMICDHLVTLPSVDHAAVDLFLAPDDLRVIGLSVPSGFPIAIGDRVPDARAVLIHKRLESGAWAWYSTDDPIDDQWAAGKVDAGLRASAYGPIVFGDELVGALVIGTTSEAFARTLVEKMPAIVAFSSTSSGLLALRMQGRRREASVRRNLEAIIAARAFHPVFQPIVDLETREMLGYEALTRFDSGQRPDLCFADANSVGLGTRLEVATLEAALESAVSLPGGRWLSVNVSPSLLAERDALHALLRLADRPLVIEVTEHEQIADYPMVRDSVYTAGRNTRLAVDDAGVGVANFNHIIELRPDFVKLDISLVRGISVDLGRQAMVVGLDHFARTAGCRLIAEGIETEQEAMTLRRLGVEFGQGYLFGRPEPVDVWRPAPRQRKAADSPASPMTGRPRVA